MHVLVMGAGVVGVTTAWYLRQLGHDVTVIDRQAKPAAETSHANGGQISVSHAEPWANPSAPLKVLRWLFKEDAPLLVRLRADPAQWRWCLRFLLECTPARTRSNIRRIVALGLYSRRCLGELRQALDLHYDDLQKGILHFYTNEAEFAAARDPARVMRDHGCDVELVDADEVVRIVRRLLELFPGVCEQGEARYWTGLRPATPSNVPYIGRSRYQNLYLNTGHGTLGWTHACGSSRALADIVSDRPPQIEFSFMEGGPVRGPMPRRLQVAAHDHGVV